MRRVLSLTGVVLLLALAAAGCDSSSPSSTPTAPTTPAPAPTPPPAPPAPPEPPPPPPAPPALSSVSLSSNDAPGQSQPTGTVTLTAAAPAGGITVRLESSNIDVARIPASVVVPQGATTATFTVNTATVPTRTTVTITANYAGESRSTTLTVTLARPRASFTVTSPTFGDDRCGLIDSGRELDCRLDGRGSEGILVRWQWVLQVVERIVTTRPDPAFAEIDTDCRFVNGANTADDSEGRRYVNMNVSLEVTDRDGSQNTTSRTVRLYTNGNCGL